MRIETNTDGQCMTSGDIDEYMSSEQHRLNVVNQVTMEDMKMENRYYITERINRRV